LRIKGPLLHSEKRGKNIKRRWEKYYNMKDSRSRRTWTDISEWQGEGRGDLIRVIQLGPGDSQPPSRKNETIGRF